jgi:hypothetical protein
MNDRELEDIMRTATICYGCNGHKVVGLVVCWDCFKRRTDITPLKYFDGATEQWLEIAEKARKGEFV